MTLLAMPPASGSETRGSIPAVFVGALYDYVGAAGVDAVGLLGPLPDPGRNGNGRLAMSRWQEMLERASATLADPHLGLSLGGSFSARHGGTLSYLLPACRTVGDALDHYARYERLFYDAELVAIDSDAHTTTVAWGPVRGRPGRLVDECAIAVFARLVKLLASAPVPLEEVCFEHEAPTDRAPYERHFGCLVRFGSGTTSLRWPRRLLETPIRNSDPVFLRVMEERAEALLVSRPSAPELEARVRAAIEEAIEDGAAPTLEHVARHLGLTTRTMRRHLDDRGTSFRSLVDGTRLAIAERLLRDRDTPLADVAQRLGFAEQSAFQRSFKRWTGETPRRHRERLLDGRRRRPRD